MAQSMILERSQRKCWWVRRFASGFKICHNAQIMRMCVCSIYYKALDNQVTTNHL